MKILDNGHKYELATLDGGLPQILTFVKRHSVEEPERFPGNTENYPGTTLQNVIRALLNRIRYLNNQIWCAENLIILLALKLALWLLEFRAARRHGRFYLKSFWYSEHQPMCIKCGHTNCNHK
jgi:hypothetical protein